jgi:hypothetical protein
MRFTHDLGSKPTVGDGGTGKTTFVKVSHLIDAARDYLLILLSDSVT